MWGDDLDDAIAFPVSYKRTALDHAYDPERQTLANLTSPEIASLMLRVNDEGEHVPVYVRSIVSGLWHPALLYAIVVTHEVGQREIVSISPIGQIVPGYGTSSLAVTSPTVTGNALPAPPAPLVPPPSAPASNVGIPVTGWTPVAGMTYTQGPTFPYVSASATTYPTVNTSWTVVNGQYQMTTSYEMLVPTYTFTVGLCEFPQITLTPDSVHLALRRADDAGALAVTRAALQTSFEEMLAARERGDWMP